MKVYVVFHNFGEGPEKIRSIFLNKSDAEKCIEEEFQRSIEEYEVIE